MYDSSVKTLLNHPRYKEYQHDAALNHEKARLHFEHGVAASKPGSMALYNNLEGHHSATKHGNPHLHGLAAHTQDSLKRQAAKEVSEERDNIHRESKVKEGSRNWIAHQHHKIGNFAANKAGFGD